MIKLMIFMKNMICQGEAYVNVLIVKLLKANSINLYKRQTGGFEAQAFTHAIFIYSVLRWSACVCDDWTGGGGGGPY